MPADDPARRRVPARPRGAGGWGDPAKRDPARIAHDVAEGKFSAEYARREYGITVDDTGAELMTATAPAS
jgi:N-methylhydantoinase B